ncbi:MAG: DNA topoisomerase IV subunit A [Magnetococcales bacterium]|nr:DNA topoisomerase IV subunit A [Magnetococcales bacterium]
MSKAKKPIKETIDEAPLRRELESRYLAYALSTIISRSLPDVRDGLKPVHRRILFAMRALRLDPKSVFKKSARVVGDVIGKFHPHGDQAAYDAMVRLAQEFAVRYPLVDGQGNFGNVDGDGAAAMRYTEARLTDVAMALLEDLDKETVPFRDTYDGSQTEPVVLPARFPNLLANGATGIAVGMSTSIPPHNVGEIIDACLLLIRKPNADADAIMEVLPGPDFPTGGVLVSSPAERKEVIATGRGGLRLRGRWHKEKAGRGRWVIVVTEIPYHVQKSRLIERIAQLIVQKKSPLLSDVRDESDAEIRIILEPKTNRVDADLIMAYLFKNTDLETRVSVNLNVIVGGTRPEVLSVRGVLLAWLEHRFDVHTRRARYELGKIEERLHLLAAHLIAHLNIDEVIAIIKEYDDPAPVMMERFKIDRVQAEAVLNLRLRYLRRLEEMKIREEIEEKRKRRDELKAMLADEKLMWNAIRKELRATKKQFTDVRRTELAEPVEEIDVRPEHLVQKEPLTVILSRQGWIRTIKGFDANVEKLRFKGDDSLRMAFNAYSTETITFITRSGRIYSRLADGLASGKGMGEPLSVAFTMEDGESIVWAMTVDEKREYFVSTRKGRGFKITGKYLIANQRNGKQVIGFAPDDWLLHVRPVWGTMLAAINSARLMLVCRLESFPTRTRGKGVRIQRLRRDETILDVVTFDPEIGIVLDSGKRVRTLTDLELWTSHRATRGATLPHGFMGGALFVPPNDVKSPDSESGTS